MDYPLIGNEDLIESLYEAYKKAPSHVDPSWQRFFSQIDGGRSSQSQRRQYLQLRLISG